jgi:hypothetical protein
MISQQKCSADRQLRAVFQYIALFRIYLFSGKPIYKWRLLTLDVHMNAIYPLFDIKTDSIGPKNVTDGIKVLKNDIEIDKLYSVNLSEEDGAGPKKLDSMLSSESAKIERI